jgi:hypothetical protein
MINGAIFTHETGNLTTLANTIAKDLGNISNLEIANRLLALHRFL